MDEKKFRSTTLRTSLLEEVSEFIKKHPEFVEKNPEYNSVAGFVDQSTRKRLAELKEVIANASA